MVYPGSERPKDRATSKSSNTNDVELDVAAVVSKTLQNVARVSPIPALRQSANLTLEITTTIQTAKGNKDNLEGLASDARELVFCVAQRDVSLDLMKRLDQVLNVLIQIKEFAEKSSSRNMFSALIRAGADAEQIQSYRQTLQQFASQFGTDINLKVMVHKLVARQAKMPEPESLENRIGVEHNGDTAPTSPNHSSNLNSTSGSWCVSPTMSNVEQNETSSSDERTGSFDDASSTTINGGGAGHDKARVKHDNSVHLGEGVNFAGAYGFNFGGSPSATWNINKPS